MVIELKVKICGLNNLYDVNAAIKFGADALGFVMGGHIKPIEVEAYAQKVREIIKLVPKKKIETVVVTHLKEPDDIIVLADYVNSTSIQISEEISYHKLKKVRENTEKLIIKTIAVNERSLNRLEQYEPYCNYILLDSSVLGYTGGTGQENDWEKCKEIIKKAKKPVFVAGGLNPENVERVIRITNPYGVDVSTGVSTYSLERMFMRKDRKDHEKIKKFIVNSKK